MVPLHAAECVLDVKADKGGGGAAGDGCTDFSNLVFGARWASCAKLVGPRCDFNLRFGGGGDDPESELDEGLGTHNGPDGALLGCFPKRSG